eukprot:Tamp_25694.p1 GENE.Tamp_25694~~Tamp_25694.p1  ORF type:complete len:232 (+),score=30.81 Tamp_25694:29-697(+)
MTLLRAGLLQQDALRKTEDSKLALYPTEAQAAASAAHVAGLESGADGAQSAAECRICKGGPEEGKLVRACRCRGSCQFVHVACLQRWLQCRPASAGSQDYNAVTVRRDISEAVAPQCEVCKAPYTVRINHRSAFDLQRCCTPRSCETYFECVSLVVTLAMLILTPWFVWVASSAQERETIMEHWPLLVITACFMVVLSLLALRKMFCRWRRLQTSTVITIDA